MTMFADSGALISGPVVHGAALRVAFQGEHGAFSEEAVRALLGEGVSLLPQLDFADVGSALRSGVADRGLLPVENSIHGSVTAAYDVLARGEFTVLAQIVRAIDLCVAALPGAQLSDIRRVISHPVALGQCQRFLRELSAVEALATRDTAGAAREVAEAGDPSVAAIAPRAAASRYGLDILREGVQDRSDNQTRFLLIRYGTTDDAEESVRPGDRHMLLLIDLRDAPGALVNVLAPFAEHGISLTSIQSRPAGEPWTYRFFIEVAATTGNALGAALDEVRRRALKVAVLGSYEQGR